MVDTALCNLVGAGICRLVLRLEELREEGAGKLRLGLRHNAAERGMGHQRGEL